MVCTPAPSVDVFVGHGKHRSFRVTPPAAAAGLPYESLPHATHMDDKVCPVATPAVLNVPMGHATQTTALVCAAPDSENLPAGHGVQMASDV